MRRIVALAVVLVVAILAPVASASVTIGSTRVVNPVNVRYSPAGARILVKFIAEPGPNAAPGTQAVEKVWSAPADKLGNGTYASGDAAKAAWNAAVPCRTTTLADDTDGNYGGAISLGVLVASGHLMTTITCGMDGWAAYVQRWVQQAPDFGANISDQLQNVNVSVVLNVAPNINALVPNPSATPAMLNLGTYTLPTIGSTTFNGWPVLQVAPRWSKFSPGGYRGYLKGEHFQYLFGSFTFAGVGVWGPGDKGGNPTNGFGRNAYIDVYGSDYVPKTSSLFYRWRRVVGVLTQQPNGTFCYEFSPKGGSKGKTGAGQYYSITVQGPGNAPDQRVIVVAPSFPFGNASYNAKTDKWGTNFSDQQAQALRDQAAQMGPDFRRPVKGTDCAQQLRQLPESFFAPPAG